MRQVKTEKAWLFGKRNPVGAAGNVAPLQCHRVNELRQRKCQNKKGDPARANPKKADQGRAAPGQSDTRNDPQPRVKAELRAENGDRIGAQSKKRSISGR